MTQGQCSAAKHRTILSELRVHSHTRSGQGRPVFEISYDNLSQGTVKLGKLARDFGLVSLIIGSALRGGKQDDGLGDGLETREVKCLLVRR